MAVEGKRLPGTVVTNYGLGARGIDVIERVGTSTVTGFPIYDSHGNNVATLTRNGTSFTIGDQRSYDAWGGVRAQQNAGDPKLRYSANLGHKQDDESGLIYMRARYYEPSSGRFVSEDSNRRGSHWSVYCSNDPANRTDHNGQADYYGDGIKLTGALFTFSALWIKAYFTGPEAVALMTTFTTCIIYELMVTVHGRSLGDQPEQELQK